LPQARFRPPAQLAHARPAGIIGNETRVPAEARSTVRVSENEPFDEFLSRWIADRFFYDGRFAGFGLAHQIDRRLNRSEVAREGRRYIGRRCRLVPRRRDMPTFLEHGLLVMPRPRRLVRLPGVFNLVMARERDRVSRKRGEHGQGEETSQRPQALVHSVVPREPTGTNHEIARSVRLELRRRYHTADSRLSRFGNSAGKTSSTMELKRSSLSRANDHAFSLHRCLGQREQARSPRPDKKVGDEIAL
jgi:hypothetical protein